MSTAGKKARFIAGYIKLNLGMAMAYRASFISQTVFMAVNDGLLLVFWGIVFARFPDIAGWSFRNLLALYAVSAGSFGLAAAFCSNFLNLHQIVAQGQLDYYLTAPQDPFLHVLVAKGWFAGWGDLLFSLGCLVFAGGGPQRFLLFPFLVLIGAAVMISANVIYRSLSFWWGRSEALSNLAFESLLTFSLWPGDIFPAGLRLLFYTIIPAGFVSYLPARLLNVFSWPLLLGLVLAAAGFVALARVVFQWGLKRYESGNLLAMRD